jgi:cation transport regulator ChaC
MLRIAFTDFIRIFRLPTAIRLAEEELSQAQRELLKAHTAEEYAHHMANYHEDRIKRLTDFINQQKEPTCQSSQSNYGTAEHVQNQQYKTSTSNSVATLKRS